MSTDLHDGICAGRARLLPSRVRESALRQAPGSAGASPSQSCSRAITDVRLNKQSTNQSISRLRKFLGSVTKYIKICCVIKPLQILVARNRCSQKMADMRSLPAHTVGHDLAHLLDSKGLKLVPGFYKHDLDHLILGYGMDPEEELCMQAYLIGNGRWQLQVFLFLSSAVLLPGLWSSLWAHYKLGRQSPAIASLKCDECLTQNTDELRRQYAPSPMLFAETSAATQARLVG